MIPSTTSTNKMLTITSRQDDAYNHFYWHHPMRQQQQQHYVVPAVVSSKKSFHLVAILAVLIMISVMNTNEMLVVVSALPSFVWVPTTTTTTTTTTPTTRRAFAFVNDVRNEKRRWKSSNRIALYATEPTKTTKLVVCPDRSPATNLRNQFYHWKYDQKIRYQCSHDDDDDNRIGLKPILLVHGLFVNSDHWRHILNEYKSNEQYIVYALDLFGCGYSDKPLKNTTIAQLCNQENVRFQSSSSSDDNSVLSNAILGTSSGELRSTSVTVDLRHPLQSPYNFYTWSQLLQDFVKDIIHAPYNLNNNKDSTNTNTNIPIPKTTIVCNSIGSISSLQAVLDNLEENTNTNTSNKKDEFVSLFDGVLVISPNFRELHSAEVPVPSISMPLVRLIQRTLRDYGRPLFDTLAVPSTVQQILYEPYAIKSAVDTTLVDVLLTPLLTPNSVDVVFDTLSYSAGPLPELQLEQLSNIKKEQQSQDQLSQSSSQPQPPPVWICYGTADPWTPSKRVDALIRYPIVEQVIPLQHIGHCPHDEAPELIQPILQQFLQRIKSGTPKTEGTSTTITTTTTKTTKDNSYFFVK